RVQCSGKQVLELSDLVPLFCPRAHVIALHPHFDPDDGVEPRGAPQRCRNVGERELVGHQPIVIKRAPPSTASPGCTKTFWTVPAFSATSSFSIFIASTTA